MNAFPAPRWQHLTSAYYINKYDESCSEGMKTGMAICMNAPV